MCEQLNEWGEQQSRYQLCILNRLDRKIEFPLPDRRQKRLIFSTITAKMNLSDEVRVKIMLDMKYWNTPAHAHELSSLHQVDLEDYVARPDRISGADINAICQEAGMHAVRENRYFCITRCFKVSRSLG